MITLIHGDDTASSREYLNTLKQKSVDPLSFDGERLIISDLMQNIEGTGLFFNEKDLFIEDLLSKRKTSKELTEMIEYINNHSNDCNVVLWEGKELTKTQTGQFKKAQVKLFKFPQLVFQFLNSITPGNGKHLVKLFHQLLKTNEPEFVLFMIQRQLRLLLSVTEPGIDTIDEVKRLQPWQLSKLQKQARMFTKERLINAYQKLYEIDLGSKTGGLNQSLVSAVDLFLLSEV